VLGRAKLKQMILLRASFVKVSNNSLLNYYSSQARQPS
jgi:hypothetical protein